MLYNYKKANIKEDHMKLKHIAALILASVMLICCGCGTAQTKPVYQSKNFTFTEDMAMYMASYTRFMLEDEMKAAGVDSTLPLSEQEKDGGETWEDYLYSKTVKSIENILLYCEAAYLEEYTVSEGMMYKANELVTYLSTLAKEAGLTEEEYIRQTYGDDVTVEALQICSQMMSLCEGYDLDLSASFEVSEEEAVAYADDNPDIFLKFDALRYTTKDKSIADSLAAAEGKDAFLKIMAGISGYSLTDSDKNGIADSLEVSGVTVASDIAGEFAKADGRAPGDTVITEADGKYTVSMLLTLPARDTESLWNFRMLFLSSKSSDDPMGDVTSLIEQWKEKEGGEEGFSNLASRYSDDPTAYYGGLFSGTSRNEMPTEDIAAWVCDLSRTKGDTTAISAGEDGAYMLYYIDGNTPRWIYDAESSIRSDKADAVINSVKEEITADFKLDEKLLLSAVKEAAKAK